jgi:hypothetical protein
MASLSSHDKLILRQAQDEEFGLYPHNSPHGEPVDPSFDKLILRQAHPSTSSSFDKLRMRI